MVTRRSEVFDTEKMNSLFINYFLEQYPEFRASGEVHLEIEREEDGDNLKVTLTLFPEEIQN